MILYFTGTGNSRFVAGQLGKLLDDQVVSINEYLKSGKRGDFKSNSPYIFVTPTYMSRMPMKIEQFIRESSFEKNGKAYFVLYVPTDFDTIEKAFSGAKAAEKGLK